jgi:hypothetical protein
MKTVWSTCRESATGGAAPPSGAGRYASSWPRRKGVSGEPHVSIFILSRLRLWRRKEVKKKSIAVKRQGLWRLDKEVQIKPMINVSAKKKLSEISFSLNKTGSSVFSRRLT